MRLALVVLALALTTPVAHAEIAEAPRMLTSLDDARACLPLASGGLAVATGGGLVLVEGSTRTVLASLDGLPDTRVHALAESPSGLWVGTEGGAALVANGKVTRTVIKPPVHAILARADGVWLGTWGDGVVRVDGARVPGGGKQVAALIEDDHEIVAAFCRRPGRADGLHRKLTILSTGARPPRAGARRRRWRARHRWPRRGLARGRERVVGRCPRARGRGSPLRRHLRERSPLGSAVLRPGPGVPRWVRGVARATVGSGRASTSGRPCHRTTSRRSLSTATTS